MNTYIITFLGTIAKPTDYKYKDVPYNAEIFPQALVRLCEFDRMYVLVTKEAKEKTYPKLEALQDDRIEPIDIEDGWLTDKSLQPSPRADSEIRIFEDPIICTNFKSFAFVGAFH